MQKNKIEKTCGICTMEKFDNRLKNSVGSSRIRMRWMLPFWKEAEEYVIGKNYNVMIFQKVYWENMKREFKGIKILDICDPDWLEKKPVFKFVDLCDATVTSTPALAEYIRKIRPDAIVKCIPDRVLLSQAVPKKQTHLGKIKKLVWFGFHHNTHYLVDTFDELIRNNVELTVISQQPFEPTLAYKGKIKIHNVPYNQDSLNQELIKADAVIMPPPRGDLKSKYKSNNKVLHAWSLGLPVIVTANDLDRLMNEEERQKEAVLRLKEIEEKGNIEISVKEYKELIETIRRKR